jgi:hypothetical protein
VKIGWEKLAFFIQYMNLARSNNNSKTEEWDWAAQVEIGLASGSVAPPFSLRLIHLLLLLAF